MNNIGPKIAQSRKVKGFSQEKLAEDAQINLRTLQRIEKGDSYPHGDTLVRIAKALCIPLEDLIDFECEDNVGYIKAMHFVTLTFILLPLGNILLPLIFWLIKKDQINNISFFAKRLINFQITWSLITYLPFAIIIFSALTHIPVPLPGFIKVNYFKILILLPLIMYSLNILYITLVGLIIKNQCRNYFPIAIKFIR
jgi:uncharacterized Tic20 family protein/DNA-binding XRE family transcriptional regulator